MNGQQTVENEACSRESVAHFEWASQDILFNTVDIVVSDNFRL